MHNPIHRPVTYVYVISTILVFVAALSFSAFTASDDPILLKKSLFTQLDSIASKKAFLKVYRVLMSQRCMNCHPAGDIPLQGEDSHLHLQGVRRGPHGKGLYALKCANCHQDHNLPGLHMPPGNPKWSLPPADMKMVFPAHLSPLLCLAVISRKRLLNKDWIYWQHRTLELIGVLGAIKH